MTGKNSGVMARIANQQVLVALGHDAWLNQCLGQIDNVVASIDAKAQTSQPAAGEKAQRLEKPTVDNDDGFWPNAESWLAQYRPYAVKDGTLSIPVQGFLAHGLSYAIGTWATGYVYIRRAVSRGMADPAVQRIALVINSGGGEVSGNFDMVDWVFAQRGKKPIWAFVDEHAYSAAYSIASAADKVVMARTGGVGSIGVLTAWVGYGKALEKAGYEVVLIFGGEHKVDGNPYEPLTAEVKARIQGRIDKLYGIFTATVARNLGLDEQVIRDTKALTYSADDAVAIGLAHEVRAFDEAMAAFSRAPTINVGVTTMELTQAELDSQLASARAEGHAAGKAESAQDATAQAAAGATAERARIDGILNHEAAANRPKLAMHLATKGNLSVEAAVEVLAASPEEPKAEQTTTTGKSAFEQAMGKNNPELGAGGEAGAEGEQATGDQATKDLIAAYKTATGQ